MPHPLVLAALVLAVLLSHPVRAQIDSDPDGPGLTDPSLEGKIFGARVLTSTSGLLAYAGYNVRDAEAFVGGGYRAPVPLNLPLALAIQPTVDYQFAGEGPLEPEDEAVLFLQLDLNLLIEVPTTPWLDTYVGGGGGLSYLRTSSGSFGGPKAAAQLGLNVLATGRVDVGGRIYPYVSVRYGSRGNFDDTVLLNAGLMVSL